MGKNVGRTVVIPKQQANVLFDAENAERFVWLARKFKLQDILEIEPDSDKFRVFDTYNMEFKRYASREEYEASKEKFMTGLTSKVEYIVLPEAARLIVKDNITVRRFFENFIGSAYKGIPILMYEFHRFFQTVTGDKLEESLRKVLKQQEPSQIIQTALFDEETQDEVGLEIVITELFGWTFVRLSAVEYNGSRFEHYVEKSDGRNIYRANSRNVKKIVDRSDIIIEKDWHFYMAERLLGGFFNLFDFQTLYLFINNEMALWLKFRMVGTNFVNETFNVRFEILEPDYTIFLE
jgi:hypothetical protein